MKYWITTDTHFNHKQLIEYGRPEDFEKKIWQGLKQAEDKDIIIHLGDVSMGKDSEAHLKFTGFNKAKKILVLGNHDTKSNKWYFEHGWDWVCKRFDGKFFGKRIAFSHRPLAWDGYFDLNLHGHFHNTDGRRQPEYESEYKFILSGYNKLLALEYNDYKLFDLEKLI